ncbi:MAG: CpaF family protein [Alphaproteobacteria bacterium]
MFSQRKSDKSRSVRSVVDESQVPATRQGEVAASNKDSLEQTGAESRLTKFYDMLHPMVIKRLPPEAARRMPRQEVAHQVSDIVMEVLDLEPDAPDLLEQRHLVATLVGDILAGPDEASAEDGGRGRDDADLRKQGTGNPTIEDAKRKIKPLLLERIDVASASNLEPEALIGELDGVVAEIRDELQIQLNRKEHTDLVRTLVDDMIGFGPLEPLLADERITDIMVNGPKQVYVEKNGKLILTDVVFQDDSHVMNVATRIVTRIGRRIDETNPICDARLPDGSRVNVIGAPLAIDGPSMSIRKFSKQKITLDKMADQSNISSPMAMLLKIAARTKLNVLISGGTGSGKTTLLNALSQLIDHGDRIVTIEDAAELQLQQPHVVRLETRPANLEGKGEVNIRDLVKNALRMRPDRIIVGEVRGIEAVDMLQAMNTGHEGSMATIHANKPRDALARLENMIGMAAINLPSKAVRTQISSALDLIVQISRMRDGVRRVTNIVEVIGMEGDVIVTQDLFTFEFQGEDESGRLRGSFRPAGVRPYFTPRAEYYGLDQALLEVV